MFSLENFAFLFLLISREIILSAGFLLSLLKIKFLQFPILTPSQVLVLIKPLLSSFRIRSVLNNISMTLEILLTLQKGEFKYCYLTGEIPRLRFFEFQLLVNRFIIFIVLIYRKSCVVHFQLEETSIVLGFAL